MKLLLALTVALSPVPSDPAQALREQYVPDRGVTFVERTVSTESGKRETVARHKGTFQFGRSGIVASDITGRMVFKNPEDEVPIVRITAVPERTIRIGTTCYISGGALMMLLPEDKTWLKSTVGGIAGLNGQPVNVLEPATLKAVLASAEPGPSGSYRGTISFARLKKLSPWFRSMLGGYLNKGAGAKQVTWHLYTDGKGLPARMVSSYPAGAVDQSAKKEAVITVDTRYSGWGTTASIQAPPEDEVTTELDMNKDEPVSP